MSANASPKRAKVERPRWWNRVTYIPLIILAVLSVAALTAGIAVDRTFVRAQNAPAPVAPPAAEASELSTLCRRRSRPRRASRG